MSNPSPSSPTKKKKKLRRTPRRFRKLRIGTLVGVAGLLSLAEPHVFRLAVGTLIRAEAWWYGVGVEIARVDGSLFEPVTLVDSHWNFTGQSGASTQIGVRRAEASFDWKSALGGNFERWFLRLDLDGVSAKVSLPHAANEQPQAPRSTPWAKWILPAKKTLSFPARVSASDVDLLIENESGSVHFEQSRVLASASELGYLRIGRMTVRQPWLERTFRDVSGSTAFEDSKLLIANLVLEPGIEVLNFSADPAELANGRLNMAFKIAAFGGEIRGEAQTLAHQHPLTIDAGGSFDKIAVAKLATFLKLSDAAGGTIKTGKFTFRGAPQQIEKATASLSLDASNFQWESRQWDSLTLNASLMSQRMHISKLDLRQGHNRLDLNGEMALPMPGVKWWQNEFTCELAARIEDMTELSALLLPEFKFAAGQAQIDGSIRGRNQQFSGQLIVAGSKLKWRNAPIENLHAAVKLEGNQCKISNIEIFNRSDYVRGSGVVNILGERQYSGELRASIDELATYAAILQKPLVPEPPAGGAVIEWEGSGSAKDQSGKFLARLNKVRSLGALAAQLHPISAELNGTYTQRSMQFSRFVLSDEQSALTADAGVGNKALSLRQIRLSHGAQLVLEGDALLPLDVWQAWPNTSLTTLLNNDTVSQVNLKATNLDLHLASQLAGWNFPVAGTLNGTLGATGAIGSLKTSGSLSLSKGRLPLGWTLTEAEGSVTFQGQSIVVEKLAGKDRFGDIVLSGTIGLQNIRDPLLQLTLHSAANTLPLFASEGPTGASVTSALDLTIEGPASGALIGGKMRVLEIRSCAGFQPAELWLHSPAKELPAVLNFENSAWNGWRLDVACLSDVPAAFNASSGRLQLDAHLGGTVAGPVFSGTVACSGVETLLNGNPLILNQSTVTFREAQPRNPTVDLKLEGTLHGEAFAAFVTGPLSAPLRWLEFQPPLSADLLSRALDPQPEPDSVQLSAVPAVSLLSPFARGVEPYEWAPIETPTISSEPPAPAENAPPAGAAPAVTQAP